MNSSFNRIAILGLGLIGSSLARALHEKQFANHIAAFDISHTTLDWARGEGFIDSWHGSATDAVRDADIVVFAVPPSAFEKIAREIKLALKPGVIVTDVASVKRQAVAALKPHLPEQAHYVPAHPIAGSEKSGVHAGRADLFKGKNIILTPEEHQVTSLPVAHIRKLWEDIGARVEYMPAELHDRIYAYVSHLPQLVAFATQSGRLAHSNPLLWSDICRANADCIDEALDEFLTFGAQIAGELSENAQENKEDREEAVKLFPKLIAACLIATATMLQEKTGIHPIRYAGAGFADMIAPADGDPQAVLLLISEHPRAVAELLTTTLGRLSGIRKAIKSNDAEKIMKALKPEQP